MVLVTGASGFVGQHFIRYLDENAVAYVKLVRKPPVYGDREIGISDLADHNIDVVVHLAGRAHVLKETSADPESEFRQANIDYTMAVVKAAVSAGAKRFVFVSSVGVYGQISTDIPLTERSPVQPTEVYAKTKLEAEKQLQLFCSEHNVELVILRPALVYGDSAPGNLAKLYSLCQKDWPLPFRKAVKTRTMLEVNSLCRALHLCSVKPEAVNKIYNVADSVGISTSDLITCFKKNLRKPDRQVAVPSVLLKLMFNFLNREKMYKQLFEGFSLDSSRLQSELSWVPCSEPATVLKTIKIDSQITNEKN